jgi:Bor protein
VSARGAVLALALAALVTGCAETFDATTLGVPATLASPAGAAPAGDHFRVSSKAVFGFWGLATLKQPSLRKALAAQLGGGSGLADVKIRTRSRFTDILFTVLTAGILVPRTVTFEGVVTK